MQDSKILSNEILDKLSNETHKYIKHLTKKKIDPFLLPCALQNAACNYLGKTTLHICESVDDLVEKLDHIEHVRDQINIILDKIKTELKSVYLN